MGTGGWMDSRHVPPPSGVHGLPLCMSPLAGVQGLPVCVSPPGWCAGATGMHVPLAGVQGLLVCMSPWLVCRGYWRACSPPLAGVHRALLRKESRCASRIGFSKLLGHIITRSFLSFFLSRLQKWTSSGDTQLQTTSSYTTTSTMSVSCQSPAAGLIRGLMNAVTYILRLSHSVPSMPICVLAGLGFVLTTRLSLASQY